MNCYGTVEMFAGRYNDAYCKGGIDYQETFESGELMGVFKAALDDWTNRGYDPFGAPRANVTMRAGDVAAMPADIRHQGYSPKRSMLLVWENNSSEIPALIQSGKAPVTAVKF